MKTEFKRHAYFNSLTHASLTYSTSTFQLIVGKNHHYFVEAKGDNQGQLDPTCTGWGRRK